MLSSYGDEAARIQDEQAQCPHQWELAGRVWVPPSDVAGVDYDFCHQRSTGRRTDPHFAIMCILCRKIQWVNLTSTCPGCLSPMKLGEKEPLKKYWNPSDPDDQNRWEESVRLYHCQGCTFILALVIELDHF